MRKNLEVITILLVAIALGLFVNFFFSKQIKDSESVDRFNKEELENFFFEEKISREELSFKYRNKEPIKILLVPGHTDQFVGAQFKQIREVDLNVAIGQELEKVLLADEHFEVINFQPKVGLFNSGIENFISNKEEINAFKSGYQRLYSWFKDEDVGEIGESVLNSDTPEEIIYLLYGINIWANKNDVDIVIHIHFNDYEGRGRNEVGLYKGFSIYVPDEKWSNSSASFELARSLKESFGEVLSPSNNLDQDQNLVHDAELISLGSFNTLEAVPILIEYGFIYETDLYSGNMIKKMADNTYIGLIDFLENN